MRANTRELWEFRHFRGRRFQTPDEFSYWHARDELGRELHGLAYNGRRDLYDVAPPEVREYYRQLAMSLTPDVLRAAELVFKAKRRSFLRRVLEKLT